MLPVVESRCYVRCKSSQPISCDIAQDSATHGTKNMIANRRMAVFVDGKKGICRSKTLRETDSRKVSSARFKSLLHDGAELIDTLIEV